MFDLDAYLERIGVSGRPDLVAVHRAHVCAIPFENLDPHRGVPVSLDEDALQRKLVTDRRGGYCFEQNLLLKSALEALGARVDLLLARVRMGQQGAIRPRSHLVLRVAVDDRVWLADVGFGSRTLREPIPFGPDVESEQSGWLYRVDRQGSDLVLRTWDGTSWYELYGFAPVPVPFVDLETSNWFTCTHPRSPFVTGLIVAVQRRDGTRVELSDWDELVLTEQTAAGATVSPVPREAIPNLLESHFGLPGFTLNGDGRVVPAG